jgi:hypothetical protein
MSDDILDEVQSRYAAVAASGLSGDQAGVRAVAEAFGLQPGGAGVNPGRGKPGALVRQPDRVRAASDSPQLAGSRDLGAVSLAGAGVGS